MRVKQRALRSGFGFFFVSSSRRAARAGCTPPRAGLLLLLALLFSPLALAHTPVVDSDVSDWCIGATSNTATAPEPNNRIEDAGASLSCGNCSVTTDLACQVNADCPGGETCTNLGSKTETAWWDNRTDGAVNDLATFATTQDNTNLYFAAELWVDPDPESLPFAEITIDYAAGGVDGWHDPDGRFIEPGRCSGSTDRGCTSDADCHFCQLSLEPTGACSVTTTQACIRGNDAGCPGAETCVERVRACGSGCDPLIGDTCDTSQTCVGLGEGGLISDVATQASPTGLADHLLAFDFGIWLLGFDLENAVLLMEPGTDLTVFPPYPGPWKPVGGCEVDSPDDPTDRCDFVPVVNPGASGGSGGPPGSVEVAIPWSAFGCTGCPDACDCPGFGPGVPFRFTVLVGRGNATLDFRPDGAVEDVFTEVVAMTTSTTTQSCPGFGLETTECEIADNSVDAMIPRSPALPHEGVPGGQSDAVTVSKSGGSSLTLAWNPSCSTGDTAYGVYEGVIGGIFDSHVPLPGGSCDIADTTLTFDPGSGNRYYLVVPTDGSTEGSYGETSSPAERPTSSTPCAPQSLGNCP